MAIERKNKETMDKDNSKTKKSKNAPLAKIETIKFDSIEGKFLLVRVGTPDEVATDKQILDIEEKLVSLFQKNNINCAAFVTHHAVVMDVIQ